MIRRTHWYLLLFVGTVFGIVSCSAQPATEVLEATKAEAVLHPDVAIIVAEAATGATMQTVAVEDRRGEQVLQFTEVDLLPEGYTDRVRYAGTGLFALQTAGDNVGDLTKEGWMESLYHYPLSGTGTRLADGQGMRFAVSNDGKYVSVVDRRQVRIQRDAEVLSSKSTEIMMGKERYENYYNEKALLPVAVEQWKSWYLFRAPEEDVAPELIRLDHTSGAIERFTVVGLDAQNIFDVDPAEGLIAYWAATTQDGASPMPTMLRVFDPHTQKTQTVATVEAGAEVDEVFWETPEVLVYYVDGERLTTSLE